MKHLLRGLVTPWLTLFATVVTADFHTFQIDEVYSNSDGTVQYVVLLESQGMNGQNLLAGHTLTSTHLGTTQTYTFPANLPGGSCSYYECSESPTANRHVLIATQGFAALALVAPDYVISNAFIATDGGSINYAGVDQVTYAALPTDGVHAIDRNGHPVQNVATNFAGRSASVSGLPAGGNYEGLWWAAPAGSESGWGINFAHQGDVIFATWFTYDGGGKAWWLSMTANKTADNVYAGTLYQTHGPAFNAVPFDPMAVSASAVGSGTLTFSDANNGSFSYTVNSTQQTKPITRQIFGALPTCTFGAQPDLMLATNYEDLWWASPAGSESGWGMNVTQQGDIIFATWFTYDLDGTPLWLSVTAPKTSPSVYSGTLYRTTGPAFNAVPFDPKQIVATATGTASLAFANGNAATFAYTVNGIAQTKQVTRQVFRSPGTICQ